MASCFLTISSIAELPSNASRIAIIGFPGAGKTTLALQFTDRPVIHTDDYLHIAHEPRPAAIQKALGKRCVVEGTEVSRLLSRGARFDVLVLVEGRSREGKGMKGLQTRVREAVAAWPGPVYVISSSSRI